MSFRKEIKFKLRENELDLFKYSLIKKGMKKTFPKRVINSCYFDTKNLKMFNESEDGILPRKKLRLRWYDNIPKIRKEIKISSIEGRFKTTETCNKDLQNLKNLIIYDNSYGTLHPTLIVKYFREYFLYKNLRFTFDTKILYNRADSSIHKIKKDQFNVCEIKTSIHTSNDYLEKIISMQPVRFSKYCRGILLSA